MFIVIICWCTGLPSDLGLRQLLQMSEAASQYLPARLKDASSVDRGLATVATVMAEVMAVKHCAGNAFSIP